MKKLVLFVLAIVLAACSAIQPKSDVDRARDKWQNANISHYRFNLFVGCFCVFSQDMPLIIVVKDGQVVSMQYQSGNEIDANNLEYFQRFVTIDKIFNEIERDFATEDGTDTSGSKADEVTVTYDETYGFPTQVNIDFIKNAADDELSLQISGFEVLP